MGKIKEFMKKHLKKCGKACAGETKKCGGFGIYDKQHEDFHKCFKDLYNHQAELHQYHRHIKFIKPLIVVFNLLIWYLIFRYASIKAVSFTIAVLISMGGCYEFFFLRRLQKKILNPIDQLQKGVEEIARGNYEVRIESDVTNEIRLLIESFNAMAQKLRESEKMKAEYEENRKTLVANISHDLKTPITSIQGHVEAILEGNAVSQENIVKYLKIINNNAVYMNKLIDDLFLFSKLDMQKLEFDIVKVEVRPFINDLMEEFKLELEEKKVELRFFDQMKEECSFEIDRRRLYRVFRNIIGNAVKYGSDGDLAIEAELYTEDGFVCIGIGDNGPGIPEDKLPYIFDRFYRIDPERTKDFMSTGLGLAISKELVEAHGGKITVTSKEHEGTCFTLMLPIAEQAID